MDIAKFLTENARVIFEEERRADMDNQWTNAQINITREELDWIEENSKEESQMSEMCVHEWKEVKHENFNRVCSKCKQLKRAG